MPRLSLRLFSILAALYLLVTFLGARPALHDESEAYYQYGQNLLATGTYGITPGVSDDFREPGYGTFLAAAALPVHGAALGTQLHFIVLVQALLFLLSLAAFLRYARLPEGLKAAFALLALFSPTLWGAHSDIYSETIPISIAVVFLTIASRPDFARVALVGVAAALSGWLAITKLYLMYFFPFALVGLLGRKATRPAALAPFFALLCLAGWSARSHFVARAEEPHHRTILQLAGKVYRPELWDLKREWKPALLASCCLNTCSRRYGAAACDKFTWTVSDNIAYQLLQDAKDHPERHDPNLLQEVLRHWWNTLPMQLVGSGLELLRMVFFEAAPVWPESGGAWRAFAQVWHLFGSLALLALAVWGALAAASSREAGVTRASALGAGFLLYHFIFMAQVTNVQRYTQPVIPHLYFFAAMGIVALLSRRAVKAG
jgi:hypothetical protein